MELYELYLGQCDSAIIFNRICRSRVISRTTGLLILSRVCKRVSALRSGDAQMQSYKKKRPQQQLPPPADVLHNLLRLILMTFSSCSCFMSIVDYHPKCVCADSDLYLSQCNRDNWVIRYRTMLLCRSSEKRGRQIISSFFFSLGIQILQFLCCVFTCIMILYIVFCAVQLPSAPGSAFAYVWSFPHSALSP